MTNYKQDYKEQCISKDEQYHILTCNMPYCLAYLSCRDQEAIGLDSLGENPTPNEVNVYVCHHMKMDPHSITIH